MSFDPLNFASSAGKTIGSMVTGAASGLTSGISNFVSNLSGSGLSINSLKGLAANKLDSFTGFLNGDPDFSRISPLTLATGRSRSFADDIQPETKIAGSNDQNSTSSITYPPTLGRDFLSIEFQKYSRPGPMANVQFNSTCTIRLPLPKEIVETQSMRLDPQDTGILTALKTQGGSLVEAAKKAFSSSPQKITDAEIDRATEQGIGLMYQGAKTIASGLSSIGVNGEQVLGMAGQVAGAVPNPHISVFFNGVDIRQPIEFSWLFSARNAQESAIIKNIIKQIKQRSLPKVTKGDQNIMSYPEMVRIALHPWNNSSDPNDFTMPTYKLGLINSFTVNYSPNGLSFFNDERSSPVFVVLSFTFQEIEVWTSSDYGGGDFKALDQLKQAYKETMTDNTPSQTTSS